MALFINQLEEKNLSHPSLDFYNSYRIVVKTTGFHPVNLGSNPSKSVMFKWLFQYWYLSTDNPSHLFKSNLWFYINLRLLKVKLSNTIVYFILVLNNLTLKNLKIFYKTYLFENIYLNLCGWLFLIIVGTSIFI